MFGLKSYDHILSILMLLYNALYAFIIQAVTCTSIGGCHHHALRNPQSPISISWNVERRLWADSTAQSAITVGSLDPEMTQKDECQFC